MKIQSTDISVTIDLAGTPAYLAHASWEDASDARMFQPVSALVSDRGQVDVHGFKLKKNGEPYASGMTLVFWGFGEGLADQPEYVKQARAMAANLKDSVRGML